MKEEGVVFEVSTLWSYATSRGVLPTVLRRCVWSRNIKNRRSIYIYIYIYDISSIRVKTGSYGLFLCWRHCNINDVRYSFAFEDKTAEADWTSLERREVDFATWQYESEAGVLPLKIKHGMGCASMWKRKAWSSRFPHYGHMRRQTTNVTELVSTVHIESTTQVYTSKGATLFFFYENKYARTLMRQVRGRHLKGNVKSKFERPHTLSLSVLQVRGAVSLGDWCPTFGDRVTFSSWGIEMSNKFRNRWMCEYTESVKPVAPLRKSDNSHL